MNRWKALCVFEAIALLLLVGYTASSAASTAPSCALINFEGRTLNVCVEGISTPTATPTTTPVPSVTPAPSQTPTATLAPTATATQIQTPTATPVTGSTCSSYTNSTGLNVVNQNGTASSPKTFKCLNVTGCVYVSNSSFVLIDNVKVTGCAGDGIAVWNSADVTVQNSYVHDLSKRGIHTNNALRIKVLNNRIENLREGSAITVWADSRRALNFTVSGNQIKNVGANLSDGAIENGISVYKVDDGLIENNTVTNAQMGGVRVNGGSLIIIRGNTLIQDRRLIQPFRAAAGVYIESVCGCGGSTDNLVDSNTIRDSDVGIEVTNLNNGTTRNTLRNNTITDNLYGGIYFEGDGLIEGNTISRNPFGLELHYGGTSNVRGNVFTANPQVVKLTGGTINADWQTVNTIQ